MLEKFSKETAQKFSQNLLLLDISEQNPWNPISVNESLTQILRLMAKKTDIHRLPVIDDDISEISAKKNDGGSSEDKSAKSKDDVIDDVVGLLTQSAVVQFILKNWEKVSEKHKKSTVHDWYYFIHLLFTLFLLSKTFFFAVIFFREIF